jgi:hypothetical protein
MSTKRLLYWDTKLLRRLSEESGRNIDKKNERTELEEILQEY